MNKLFTKIATACVGLAMAVGVGVAVGGNGGVEEVKADTTYEYVETDLSDLTASDYFVIVGNNGSNYAMTNNNGASSAPAASTVTISNGKITTAVTSTLLWTMSVSDSSYTFYPNGNEEAWLYCTSNNNGVRVGTNANKTFTISTEGYLKHSGTNRYVGIYNSEDWRCYTSINNNIKDQTFSFYKRQESSGQVDWTVTYNINGGEGTVPTDATKYNSTNYTVTVLANQSELTKTGHTFAGWTLNQDGSGTVYTAGQSFDIEASVILYAKWTPNQYALSYDLNGGTGTVPESTNYDYGTKVEVDDGSNISKEGFVFSGWNTQADGKGTKYGVGSKVTIEAATILYAIWKEPSSKFIRVESVDDLEVGDEIVIVSSGSGAKKAMSTTQNSNNRGAVDVTISEDFDFELIDDIQLITLGKSNSNWTFAVEGGYLYAASSGSNHLKTQETNDANGEWAITITDGVASIVAQGTNTRNKLMNNGAIFSCYTGGQTSVSIYKEDSSVVYTPESLRFEPNSTFKTSYKEGQSWDNTTFTVQLVKGGNDNPKTYKYETLSSNLTYVYKDGNGATMATPAAKTGVTLTVTSSDYPSFDPLVSTPFDVAITGLEGTYNIVSNLSSTYTVVSTPADFKLHTDDSADFTVALAGEVRFGANDKTGQPGKTSDIVLPNSSSSLSLSVASSYMITRVETKVSAKDGAYDFTLGSTVKRLSTSAKAVVTDYPFASSFTISTAGWAFMEYIKVTVTKVSDTNSMALAYGLAFNELTATECSAMSGISDGTWTKVNSLYTTSTTANSALITTFKGQSDEDGNDLEQALFRYDLIVYKYKKTNFMSRDAIQPNSGLGNFEIINSENSSTLTVVVVMSIIGAAAVGGYFLLRKKKEQ